MNAVSTQFRVGCVISYHNINASTWELLRVDSDDEHGSRHRKCAHRTVRAPAKDTPRNLYAGVLTAPAHQTLHRASGEQPCKQDEIAFLQFIATFERD